MLRLADLAASRLLLTRRMVITAAELPQASHCYASGLSAESQPLQVPTQA